jgi:hypothetical protein
MIGVKPAVVNKKTVFASKLYEPLKPKYKFGNRFMCSKVRGLFEKTYTPYWSTEVLHVYKSIPYNLPKYRIRDLRREAVQGLFCEPELLKTKYCAVHLAEKVFKRRAIRYP